ncbi:hypothetical protein K461DRAFT_267332 [Myriangium duriaei CBS 260.36]|uniref:Uncharacterized protein n=1 Tax=Myriangium duriaei CBS 260.36 TaxID=1168546 RepID=A0A9P4J6D7_9PEZI|nr:hypothetical protein K461DRAFT_267332 [Myriangium duriaei CBS 260.36]
MPYTRMTECRCLITLLFSPLHSPHLQYSPNTARPLCQTRIVDAVFAQTATMASSLYAKCTSSNVPLLWFLPRLLVIPILFFSFFVLTLLTMQMRIAAFRGDDDGKRTKTTSSCSHRICTDPECLLYSPPFGEPQRNDTKGQILPYQEYPVSPENWCVMTFLLLSQALLAGLVACTSQYAVYCSGNVPWLLQIFLTAVVLSVWTFTPIAVVVALVSWICVTAKLSLWSGKRHGQENEAELPAEGKEKSIRKESCLDQKNVEVAEKALID